MFSFPPTVMRHCLKHVNQCEASVGCCDGKYCTPNIWNRSDNDWHADRVGNISIVTQLKSRPTGQVRWQDMFTIRLWERPWLSSVINVSTGVNLAEIATDCVSDDRGSNSSSGVRIFVLAAVSKRTLRGFKFIEWRSDFCPCCRVQTDCKVDQAT
jgi:hypothetical protein